MDHEVARTLDELERKIAELERTLDAMNARAAPAPAEERGAAGALAAQAPPGAPPGRASLAGAERGGRIIDESLEPVASPAGAHPAQRAPVAPAPAARAAPASASAPPARTPPATPATVTAPASYAGAGVVAPARTPPPDELLRFRARLERAAVELTHEYDALLGRLSYAAVSTPPGPAISFARGAPSLDIIDVQGLRDAADRAFQSDPAGTTSYGTAVGYPRLRSWIADRHGVEPERVLVTNGSMQADAFLFEHLVRQGSEVIVERPTYDRTLLSLRDRGADLHAVELDTDGIDTDALAQLLRDGARPVLAHIIPNFQNPAGYTLSLARRRHLLELAAEHRFVIFEDDPYVALRFTGDTLPTMLSLGPDRVVYASSFSKTVCPGIRVGYLVGPTDVIAEIAKLATSTYISPNMVAQSIVYEFCASGAIERSIETVKAALSERARALAQALREELPQAVFVAPDGGYFMWVTLPEGTDVDALHRAASERGVIFVKGSDFVLDGGGSSMRLAYSGVTPEQIRAGVARLADAYRSL